MDCTMKLGVEETIGLVAEASSKLPDSFPIDWLMKKIYKSGPATSDLSFYQVVKFMLWTAPLGMKGDFGNPISILDTVEYMIQESIYCRSLVMCCIIGKDRTESVRYVPNCLQMKHADKSGEHELFCTTCLDPFRANFCTVLCDRLRNVFDDGFPLQQGTSRCIASTFSLSAENLRTSIAIMGEVKDVKFEGARDLLQLYQLGIQFGALFSDAFHFCKTDQFGQRKLQKMDAEMEMEKQNTLSWRISRMVDTLNHKSDPKLELYVIEKLASLGENLSMTERQLLLEKGISRICIKYVNDSKWSAKERLNGIRLLCYLLEDARQEWLLVMIKEGILQTCLNELVHATASSLHRKLALGLIESISSAPEAAGLIAKSFHALLELQDTDKNERLLQVSILYRMSRKKKGALLLLKPEVFIIFKAAALNVRENGAREFSIKAIVNVVRTTFDDLRPFQRELFYEKNFLAVLTRFAFEETYRGKCVHELRESLYILSKDPTVANQICLSAQRMLRLACDPDTEKSHREKLLELITVVLSHDDCPKTSTTLQKDTKKSLRKLLLAKRNKLLSKNERMLLAKIWKMH